MKVVIAKVDEVYFDGEAQSLTAPGVEGEMTILGEHMPMVTTLKAGELIVRVKGEADKKFPVEGGVLEIRHDGATVIL
ncbi:MAG TPA: F0F1 ATP synthase subunit epsilon [Candidatus Paceibacterota bacterium]|nr:F0F1 ATP synthase subunit epsilon [Candidatus Paceibacterota bacterium]